MTQFSAHRIGCLFCGWRRFLPIVTVALLSAGCGQHSETSAGDAKPVSATNGPAGEPSVELSQSQLNSIKIEPLGTFHFPVTVETIGNVDFDNDLNVQVLPTVQGRLIKAFAKLGDNVKKGQELYTIDSPDLATAESTLISAAASNQLTTQELARAKDLFAGNVGVSQRELEQAVNDQKAAGASLRAARGALRVLGKTDAEMDDIIKTGKIESTLVVRSPIDGQVTAYNAAPGTLIQTGAATAPVNVADLTTKWVLAAAPEEDAALFRVGQPLEIKVAALPGRVFTGKVSQVYAAVDPSTHRITLRSDVADPQHELRAGMTAEIVIEIHESVEAPAIPANGIVREGDGTLTAWTTTDRHHFVQKTVKIGLRENGLDEVVEGLQPGQLVVSDGAVFLSNMLNAPPDE
jgi:cobalt-zinc-cadmium efflux system membrane fusion protein